VPARSPLCHRVSRALSVVIPVCGRRSGRPRSHTDTIHHPPSLFVGWALSRHVRLDRIHRLHGNAPPAGVIILDAVRVPSSTDVKAGGMRSAHPVVDARRVGGGTEEEGSPDPRVVLPSWTRPFEFDFWSLRRERRRRASSTMLVIAPAVPHPPQGRADRDKSHHSCGLRSPPRRAMLACNEFIYLLPDSSRIDDAVKVGPTGLPS